MTRIRLIVLVILLIMLALFTLQNTEVITVQFLFFNTSMSGAILILLTTIIGFGVGYITALIVHLSRRRSKHAQESPDV